MLLMALFDGGVVDAVLLRATPEVLRFVVSRIDRVRNNVVPIGNVCVQNARFPADGSKETANEIASVTSAATRGFIGPRSGTDHVAPRLQEKLTQFFQFALSLPTRGQGWLPSTSGNPNV